MEQLKFESTYTVEQFKKEQNVDKISVRKSDTTGKLFFIFGGKTGAVSQSADFKEIAEHPMISLVEGEKTEQNPDGRFFLLHKEGNGGEEIATF